MMTIVKDDSIIVENYSTLVPQQLVPQYHNIPVVPGGKKACVGSREARLRLLAGGRQQWLVRPDNSLPHTFHIIHTKPFKHIYSLNTKRSQHLL